MEGSEKVGRPLTMSDIEVKGINFEIKEANSIAQLFDIVVTDLKNGVQLGKETTITTSKDLQSEILRGLIKGKSEEKKDPIGLQKKITELADDNVHPVRSQLDWLLLDVAKRAQKASEQGSENLAWKIEYEGLNQLDIMMTADQNNQQLADSEVGIKLEPVHPLDTIRELLEEGRRQKVIGKDAYIRTPEYEQIKQLSAQAYKLRDELEGGFVERKLTLELQNLNDQNVTASDSEISVSWDGNTIVFEPHKLALGILTSDIAPLSSQKIEGGETQTIVHAYLPHYEANKLVSKTEIAMPLEDSRFLLEQCYKGLGLTKRGVDASLDNYNILINTSHDKELYRYSAAYALRKQPYMVSF